MDGAPEEPTFCNNRLDHLEEDEGHEWDISSCSSNSEYSHQEECISPYFLEANKDPKWDLSSCSSNSKLLCQKEFISLDVIEDIPCEMHEKSQVLNFGIFNEIVDVSCTSCHQHSLHDSFEEKFDSV